MNSRQAGVPSADEDQRLMRAALALGRRGLGTAWPNPAVGCLLVRHEAEGPRIVGRGWTQPGGRPHAETQALAEAGPLARGATAYVTLEPCSHVGRTGPCADALARAGVARVVAALRDPDPRVSGRGFHMLVSYGVAVADRVCEDEAEDAHLGHIMRISRGRPAVMLKMALSADGFVAGEGGHPLRISGPEASARVQLLRAQADAIAVGVGTVLRDDPLLTVRLPGLEGRRLVRVVFDTELRLPLASRLVTSVEIAPLWILAGVAASDARGEALRQRGAEVIRIACAPNRAPGSLDAAAALRALGARGLTRLMVEGGPTFAARLVAADLVDEAILFASPDPIGQGVEAFDRATRTMLETRLARQAVHQVGRDVMTIRRRS